MRYLLTAAAAAFLLLPASQKAGACGAQHSAEADALVVAQAPEAATEALAQVTDFSAKKKKEKVEYMKSAAGPEPTVKKHKKKKHKKAKKKAM